MNGERNRELSVAQDLHWMFGADDASLPKHFGSDRGFTEPGQLFQIHDVEFFAEDVGETALGHAAMERHLAAFKATHHARTAARTLALVSAGRSFAHAGTHTAADALLAGVRLLGCSNIRQIHICSSLSRHSSSYVSTEITLAQFQPGAGFSPPFRESRDCRDAQSPGSIG